MDIEKEISTFKALLQLAASSGDDLGAELSFQKNVLRSLGMTNVEINEIIHDKESRRKISIASCAIALASVRNAARLYSNSMPVTLNGRSAVQPKTREALASEYLRARGKEPRQVAVAPSIPPSYSASKIGSEDLLVPYGIDPDANIVHARDADPATHYSCPCCETALILHAGAVKIRHFAHKANTACNGETLEHITAKLLIAKAIRDHHLKERRVRIQCTCDQCHSSFEKSLPIDAFSSSEVEVPVGRFVCDVVAFKGNASVLAVEIVKSHAVSKDKGDFLELPWIELKATDVLEDPHYWRPIQSRLKPTVCPTCRSKRAKIEEVGAHWKLPTAHPDYVAALARCWSCKEEIIWYWWRGVPFAEKSPPAPIPPIVQRRHSKMYGGSYWMNVCPGCDAAQGDNFVFLSPDSPFKGLPLNDTDSMKRHRQQHSAGLVSQFMRIVRRNT